MKNRKSGCSCLLCRPVSGKAAHPTYGYDLAKVGAVKCIDCSLPIGDEPYVEELGTARFGSMSFRHRRCENPKAARARAQMEKNWQRRTAAKPPRLA
jgi:hypothetical protein